MAHLPSQLEGISHHGSEIAMGLQLEDLRTDVGVQTTHLGPAALLEVLKHRLKLIGVETELAVEVTGADVLVRMALDPRREPQHQAHGMGRRQAGQLLDVEPVVGHHRHPKLHRQAQLLETLVIAVEDDPLRLHPTLHGGEQLTGRHRIKPQALRSHHSRDRQAAVGL